MLTVATFRGCVRESSIQMRLLNGDAFVFSIQIQSYPFGSSDLSPSPCLGFLDWIRIHGVASRVVALDRKGRERPEDERASRSSTDDRPIKAGRRPAPGGGGVA